MKGTEKIIAHIEADAQEQAEAILSEASKKCEEIRTAWEEKASSLYSEKIREGVKACQDREDGALRISRMEARKQVLAVKQEMVSKSFELAQEKILSLPESEYVAFLAGLVADAGASGEEEILLNARDRAAVGEALLQKVNGSGEGARMTLSPETRDIAGGLILRNGAVETNCSVELLIDLCRGELSAKLADVLFG